MCSAKVGGLDIAGMAGVFLGGAACRIPVVADGFISCGCIVCDPDLSGSERLCNHITQIKRTSIDDDPGGTGYSGILDCDMCLGEEPER